MAQAIIDYSSRLDDLENEVTEVTALLRDNVEKVLERGERIEKLQSRSENLEWSSSHFRTSTVRLRKKIWWRNCKLGLVLGAVIVTIITIAVVIIVELKPWETIERKHNGTFLIGNQAFRELLVILWPKPPLKFHIA